MIERFKKENILYKLMTLGLIAGLVFFVARVLYGVLISADYPRELLEPSNIALTRAFLTGKIPYTLDSLSYEVPAINYEYPFVSSLLAAGIVALSGCRIVTAHYIISTLAFLGTGVLGYLIIKPYSRTSLAPVAGAILFMMCHWRFGFISAAPDDLGLFLFVLTLYISISEKISYKPLICATLTTVCFYTKQYFVFVALGIFVYMLLYSKKEAVKFFLWTCGINIIVAVLISLFWPLYWTYTFFFLYNGTFSGIGFGLSSLFEQMKYLSAIFIGMFGVLIGALGWLIVKNVKSRKVETASDRAGKIETEAVNESKAEFADKNIDAEDGRQKDLARKGFIKSVLERVQANDALSLFVIEIPVMFLPLIFFGRNDGAFLSYFLQLWMPSIIVVTLIVLEKIAGENEKQWFALAYGIIVAFTVLFSYLKLPFHILTKEEKAVWEEALDTVREYRQKGDVYYASEFAYLAADNGDDDIFCGHDGEVSEVSLETWNNSPLCQKLFPYADDIIKKNVDYKNNLSIKAFNAKYSLITFVEDYCLNFSGAFIDENLPFYTKIGEYTLQTGNMPYTVTFYKLKEGTTATILYENVDEMTPGGQNGE